MNVDIASLEQISFKNVQQGSAFLKSAKCDIVRYALYYAFRMSEDRKLWKSSRPSLRCQPLLEGVAKKYTYVKCILNYN